MLTELKINKLGLPSLCGGFEGHGEGRGTDILQICAGYMSQGDPWVLGVYLDKTLASPIKNPT